ncbi:sulfurtransferase complex subunit TusD [Paraferrimonas sp. SM1919]|uniref:sulfurtransferase complex subunit TusD n=1 Tax=Paraferrimonas sp. SM1919 TaxID=2662263 RepID=UPI0013D4DAF6|nr:sulfurtransferase complex subunit TusD [Paraferrimonas sp. SM1919]
MQKFALLINQSQYSNQSSHSAYQFATAVLKQGHPITKVFFYQQGVDHGNALTTHQTDELNMGQQWQQLATDNNFELVVCASAALRRGVVSKEDAETNDLSSHNLAKPYLAAGLGDLVTAIESSDKLVQF